LYAVNTLAIVNYSNTPDKPPAEPGAVERSGQPALTHDPFTTGY
jgi:hypothetical protein